MPEGDNKATLIAANAAIDRGDNDGFLSSCTDEVGATAIALDQP